MSDEYSKDEIIKLLAHGESFSNHPIAKSIVALYDGKIDNKCVKNFKEITGKGLSYEYNGKLVKIGSVSICDDCDIDTYLHVNIDGVHVCSIVLDDGIKKNANFAIDKLSKLGIKTMIFTGDKKETALAVASKLGTTDTKYEMLPEDKFKEYENVSASGLTAFVGDGINDAPVLKRADIGIAMGALGSDAAIEAADIVLMDDDIRKIASLVKIARKTLGIVKQNIVFALAVKALVLLLGALGMANMWEAVFADVGVSVIAILNSMRTLNTK